MVTIQIYTYDMLATMWLISVFAIIYANNERNNKTKKTEREKMNKRVNERKKTKLN